MDLAFMSLFSMVFGIIFSVMIGFVAFIHAIFLEALVSPYLVFKSLLIKHFSEIIWKVNIN